MHIMSKRIFVLIVTLFSLFGCNRDGFTPQERKLIGRDPQSGIMRVLTVNDRQDSLFLRQDMRPLTARDVRSPYFDNLCRRMLVTVTDPSQDGVGIAAPQVGIAVQLIAVQLIAVQRFDVEGEPFGLYVNPRITMQSEELVVSGEGCLSVPDKSGKVMRAERIQVTYNDALTFEEKTEDLSGFTAIIFQHEIDHLSGKLYTDILLPEETE